MRPGSATSRGRSCQRVALQVLGLLGEIRTHPLRQPTNVCVIVGDGDIGADARRTSSGIDIQPGLLWGTSGFLRGAPPPGLSPMPFPSGSALPRGQPALAAGLGCIECSTAARFRRSEEQSCPLFRSPLSSLLRPSVKRWPCSCPGLKRDARCQRRPIGLDRARYLQVRRGRRCADNTGATITTGTRAVRARQISWIFNFTRSIRLEGNVYRVHGWRKIDDDEVTRCLIRTVVPRVSRSVRRCPKTASAARHASIQAGE